MPICQICNQREASLFITRNLNGQKTQISVCRQCAAESGIVKIDLNKLLAGLAAFTHAQDEEEEKNVEACQGCGMTLAEFNNTGRMGCSQCYGTFAEPMEHLLNRIHGHARHIGKHPGQTEAEESALPGDLERLKSELTCAIAEEAYEKAADLRDRIRELERRREVRT